METPHYMPCFGFQFFRGLWKRKFFMSVIFFQLPVFFVKFVTITGQTSSASHAPRVSFVPGGTAGAQELKMCTASTRQWFPVRRSSRSVFICVPIKLRLLRGIHSGIQISLRQCAWRPCVNWLAIKMPDPDWT